MDEFVPTRVSRLKGDVATEQFVSVSYGRPKKDKASDSNESGNKQKFKLKIKGGRREDDVDEKKKQEAEMKRIRYEVMKFGMSGFQGDKAEEANVALALSLGAKPPKRKGINYKVLQSERKKQKEEEKEKKHVSGLEKSLLKPKVKKAAHGKKKPDGILGVYGKVGKRTFARNKK